MGGALLVAVPAFRVILKRPRPVLAEEFELPAKKDLGARLLAGSALFGVGWARGVLSGFAGDRAGLGARACVRVRSGDGRGDGTLQAGLLASVRQLKVTHRGSARSHQDKSEPRVDKIPSPAGVRPG
jgi:hypothetical protein